MTYVVFAIVAVLVLWLVLVAVREVMVCEREKARWRADVQRDNTRLLRRILAHLDHEDPDGKL